MVDIEPYKYQRKTNLKEHNDLVAKINEIVDVINNTNLDTILPKISKLETDVSTIKATDGLQWTDIESLKDDVGVINPKIAKLEQDVTDINSVNAVQNTDISNLKAKDSEHDSRLGTVDTEINGITKSLVSDVAILNGTTSGNVKVRIGRKDSPSIDSDDYNIQKPTSVELIQGSAPAMVKAQITLSDGTVLISDDFMFTTEAIGQDVYISSFVFKNGNVAGTISADIGLSNGSTLTANNFVVPTDPNVTTAIADLQTRLTTVENSGVIDISALKTTVSEHTSEINTLNSDVAGLMTDKADVNNTSQTIIAGTINATNINKNGVSVATVNDIPSVPDISGKVDKAQGVSNAGKVLGIGSDGNVTPVAVSSGGENWEEVNLSNIPTDWVKDDRIKVAFRTYYATHVGSIKADANTARTAIFEFILPANFTTINCIIHSSDPDQGLQITNLGGAANFNGDGYMFTLEAYALANSSASVASLTITRSNAYTNIYKMWRLKK